MTNVDLVYQALVIHPKWVRFTNAQDPVMTGRRWYGSDMDALWLKPNFFDKRHIPNWWKIAIWGQQEVFESQLEYHAGAAHFLGGPGHRCCPPVVFWGFQRGGGPSYHPARGGRQLGMLSEKKLAAKARIPWFYHQTMEHMENTPKSHGWKMLKTSSSPSLYRIELHHIVGLSPILWEKPMSYGCSCVYRIFKYIPYITIHYICSILTHHFRSFYPQKDTRCSQIVASDIHLLLVLSHDPSKSYHNPHCITINIPILMVGVALLYTYITNEGIPIKCGLLYILLHTSHPNYWHPNYSHAIVEFKGILTLIKWGVISQRTQGRVKHIYISQ
jgi:hypothetical protein